MPSVVKTPRWAGGPALCLFGVPRGSPARWTPNPLPHPPITSILSANLCPVWSQQNHPNGFRTWRMRPHNGPTELRRAQRTQRGRARHRIKPAWWIRWL